MRTILGYLLTGGLFLSLCRPVWSQTDLWDLAARHQAIHRYSTLFTAQDVRQHLSTEEGIQRAMAWCKQTAVTKVYIETFRDGYQAERATLTDAKNRFRAAGFLVSGCITPTGIGKLSTGWKVVSCYTDRGTQEQVRSIFEFAAGLFDEIMIDDFWFTDCTCAECQAARASRRARVGDKEYPVAGESWEDYRCELMMRLSEEAVLAAARRVNPGIQLILKYPQWYDRFHERGYDVLRQTEAFDRIWVGTESRDYNDSRWGGTVQYESYFIMRWLGSIGGGKCGGGWFDWLGTTEKTYLEQARQTVLGGARESMLFCYGGLQGTTGPKNVLALRKHIPELFATASQVRDRRIVGLAAYKPGNSHPENESRVFDFVGMLGLPLVPCHEFPTNAPAAFFSLHALKDSGFVEKLEGLVAAGKPILLTDGLAARLQGKAFLQSPHVRQIPVQGDPKSLLTLNADQLNDLRAPLLRPFQTRLAAPGRVALYLFADGSWVLENFNDDGIVADLNGQSIPVAARGWKAQWKQPGRPTE